MKNILIRRQCVLKQSLINHKVKCGKRKLIKLRTSPCSIIKIIKIPKSSSDQKSLHESKLLLKWFDESIPRSLSIKMFQNDENFYVHNFKLKFLCFRAKYNYVAMEFDKRITCVS